MLRLVFFAASLVGVFQVPLMAQDESAEPEQKPEPKRGLVRYDEEAAFRGYNLITPLRSKDVFLFNMEGEVVHQWKTDLPPGNSVYLRDNGNLLRCARVENEYMRGGGAGGRVQEFTWDGEVVWDYTMSDKRSLHHHDIEPLPNGNLLLISWQRMSRDKAIEAGRDPELLPGTEFWPDYVVEIKPKPPSDAEVVWEWHAFDHIIQDFDPDRPNYGEVAAHPELVDINADRVFKRQSPQQRRAEAQQLRQLGYLGNDDDGDGQTGRGSRRRDTTGADWMHTNGIDYNAELDQIVLSIRTLSEVWVIDHSTTSEEAAGHSGGRSGKGGDILYRYGNPRMYHRGGEDDARLFHQHDVQWVAADCPGAGGLTWFNNGSGRPGGDRSTVEIIMPPVDERGRYRRDDGAAFGPAEFAWQYGLGEDQRFYSSFISGVQRLPNGNTLICSGAEGRIFEVALDGRVVWDFLSEFGGDLVEPERRGPPPGRGDNGPGGGPPGEGRRGDGPPPGGGRGGPPGMSPYGLFRATRIHPDHPGLSRLRDV